jgi:hypothetical protein
VEECFEPFDHTLPKKEVHVSKRALNCEMLDCIEFSAFCLICHFPGPALKWAVELP